MKFNTAELLALCGKGKCRRDRACSGDPVACFDGKWQALPEEFKNDVRAAIGEAAQRAQNG
jgi:hypothetical protein